MKKFCSVFFILFLTLLLNGCSDGDSRTDAVSGAGDVSATPPVSDNNTSEYTKQSTYSSYGVRNGGRRAWRIPGKGPSFGNKIKVVFSNGHTVIVNNTSKNYREGDGFVFKPGIGPNGHGDSNTGTAHGGVYLHAPYGNKSTRVTFHYNGK